MTNSLLPRAAVFDVDRTLIRGTSAEMQLIRFLKMKRLLPRFILGRMVMEHLRKFFKGPVESLLKNKMYLQGVNESRLRELLPEFFETCVEPKLSPAAMKRFTELKNQGYEIYLISGTLSFIVDLLVERLQARGGTGSVMEVEQGTYTGRVTGAYLYNRQKVLSFQNLVKGQSIDYGNSWAFGDSGADASLLSLFGHPVAVNPGVSLTLVARLRKWTILRDL